jgi:hypothetical protein
VCDIIWCKQEVDGKTCDTINYLDPYCFWDWEGTINCAECGMVYYIHMIKGFMYSGPEERPGETPDTSPLYADKPYDGYSNYRPGVEGRTRPYECKPRSWLTGTADMVKFSIRGRPVRGWRPQPPSAGLAGSFGFFWDIQRDAPEIWEEYQQKLAAGEVGEW